MPPTTVNIAAATSRAVEEDFCNLTIDSPFLTFEQGYRRIASGEGKVKHNWCEPLPEPSAEICSRKQGCLLSQDTEGAARVWEIRE